MDSFKYYPGGKDFVSREIRLWVKYIVDWRNASQAFTDSLMTSVQRLEQIESKVPATVETCSYFKHFSEAAFASYKDIWRELDDEESPYVLLLREQKEQSGRQRSYKASVKSVLGDHVKYENDVLRFKWEYEYYRERYGELLDKRGNYKPVDESQKITLQYLKFRMKTALVKYRTAFKAEYEQRTATQKNLRGLQSAWKRTQESRLKLLGQTLQMFQDVVFKMASSGLRKNLMIRAQFSFQTKRERHDYINDHVVKETRFFLSYEGPTATNPIEIGEPDEDDETREGEGRTITTGWGPFKRMVILSPSSVAILDNDEDYVERESSEMRNSEASEAPSLVSRIENVKVRATKYFIRKREGFLTIAPGTEIIQVRSANNKGLAYGYTKGALGLKTYGYYPADSVSI